MTLFWLLAAGLGIAALALVLPALLRPQAASPSVPDARSANLAVLRAQLAQIDADHASGVLDAEQHRRARAEVSRRVLDEEAETPAAAVAGPSRRTAISLAVLVPAAAIAFYVMLGSPAALLPQSASIVAGAGAEVTPEKIAQMVELLTARTRDKPDDAEAWTLLGHGHRALQRFPEAVAAYRQAVKVSPPDAALLADLAYALSMDAGSAVGEPTRLLDEALKLAPEDIKTLSLAGSAAFERQDFAQAIAYWSRARSFAPPGSAFIADLDQSLAQAREAAGSQPDKPGAGPSVSAQAGSPLSAGRAATTATATVSGRVSLAPALAAQAQLGDTVFIFARAAEGPRMPLAIVKKQVRDLPFDFVLDDSSAMSAATTLSQFKTVVVGARVSRSGQASPTAGDLLGQSAPVAVGSGAVGIVIDRVQP
jgi:cytochrome c-type biogenesis protein CcmH